MNARASVFLLFTYEMYMANTTANFIDKVDECSLDAFNFLSQTAWVCMSSYVRGSDEEE